MSKSSPEQTTEQKWLAQAIAVLRMAEDLQQRGCFAEAIVFALAAQERVQAAQAMRRMQDAGQDRA